MGQANAILWFAAHPYEAGQQLGPLAFAMIRCATFPLDCVT